jgi:hypothetical protein
MKLGSVVVTECVVQDEVPAAMMEAHVKAAGAQGAGAALAATGIAGTAPDLDAAPAPAPAGAHAHITLHTRVATNI